MDIKEIIEAVARCYDTSVSDILSPSRDEKTITARHVAIYLARSRLSMSLPEIAKAFNRTHATILFAERKVRERMADDEVFRSEVEQLRRQIGDKKQRAETKNDVRMACDDERGVKFLGMTPLNVVQLKIGKEGRTSHHFSPSVGGLPKEFFILPEVEWRNATDDDIRGALRRYVAALREEGETVELLAADTGVVRIDLTLDGESRRLWFNARTSDTVVLDADGNVCRNIREAIQDYRA